MVLRSLLHLRQIRKNLKKDMRELEKLQNDRLRAIIKYAYENVPFYHRKFDAARIKPSDVKNVWDLRKVPVTTKAELRAVPIEDVLSINCNVNECGKRMTSGSTGVPLNIYLDRKALIFEGLVLKRTFFENGLKLRDRMAVINDPLRNPNEKKGWLQRFGFMSKLQISIFDDVEKQLAALEQYDPDVLRGYSSIVSVLAHHCKGKATCLRPRLIFTGAEILSDAHRRMICGVFLAELFDFYGSLEFGHMAWECEEHMGYHINVDSVVMEFVKQGEHVDSGERGEILGTNLYNSAMPFIRYNLDDVGTPMEQQCACERSFPLMKVIEGRTDDSLLALDGRLISCRLMTSYALEDAINEIRQFRFIQEKRDSLRVQLVVDEDFDRVSVLPRVEKRIRDILGEGVQVEFDLLDQIVKDASGKIRRVISKISGGKMCY